MMRGLERPEFDEQQWALVTPLIQRSIRYLMQVTDHILQQGSVSDTSLGEVAARQTMLDKRLFEHEMQMAHGIGALTASV